MNTQIKILLKYVIGLAAIITLYIYLIPLVDFLINDLLKLNPEKAYTESIHFFIYDSIKILILIFVISSVMGIVNAYFPVDRLRHFLTTKKLYGLQYFVASIFGAITPFCSCSSIPLFIGFVRGGIPLGVTFSFLITSPLVNEVAVAMFLGSFGLEATLYYVTGGIVMGSIGGYLLGKMKLENQLTDWVKNVKASGGGDEGEEWTPEKKSFIERLPSITHEGWEVVRKVLIYVLIGIGVGAVIHGYVPENFFEQYLSKDKWYAIPLAVICAVPLYANAAGVVPIVQVFVAKGVPLGTAIAFMMSAVGLSLPEATMLKQVMKWKLIGIFFGTVTLFIIILGYLFNFIL